ncbi:hypothetical protein KY321_04400, partial [Candidatus Woesearchaeota archaeon]|nr:hypothetical protein [Candidatus Woesearchaeota archaeon]
NIARFKEQAYYVGRNVASMKFYDDVHPILPEYLKNVEWKNIGNNIEDAAKNLGNYFTDEDHYEEYKTIIRNIIKGTLTKRAFSNLFNQISPRLPKPKKSKVKYYHPNPPSMYSDEDRRIHDKMRREAREEAKRSEYWEDDVSSFDEIGESFISLSDYKKLKE